MTTPIPQPPGLPLLGNIRDVDPNNTWMSLNKLGEKYGEICQITVLGHTIVFIASAALLEEICDEKRFRKAVVGPIVEIRAAVHDALFTAYDSEASWGVHHRIMYPLLSPSTVPDSFMGARDAAAQLTAKWCHASQQVNVTGDLRRLSLKATSICQFNEDQDCLEGPEPPMLQAMDDSALESMKRPNRPRLLNWLLYQGAFDRNIKIMRDFAADIVTKRQAKQNPPENDMLHAMLHGKDPKTSKSLTPEQVIDEIVSLFIGVSTAPCLLSHVLYYLLKNPAVTPKARTEIDTVVGRNGELQVSHLSQLPYCEAILHESLRLAAPAPGFNIEPLPTAAAPITIGGGKYAIPQGQTMIALLHTVNRDPAVFSDPEAFKPERMLDGGYEKLPAGVKKGFGNGKRECIGKEFAWMFCMVTLVSVIKDVDLRWADEARPYELKLNNGAYNIMPIDFFAKTAPRMSQA